MVQKTIDVTPNVNYIFAVDNDNKNSQRKIVNAIANGIGGGRVKHISFTEGACSENFDIFTLNVWLKSTAIFDNAEETDY